MVTRWVLPPPPPCWPKSLPPHYANVSKIQMWDNFARLTALLGKVRVWFNNSTIHLDFSAIFSEIAPSKLITKGRHQGALSCRRGAPFWLGLLRYATAKIPYSPCILSIYCQPLAWCKEQDFLPTAIDHLNKAIQF